jgi:UDP-N-acetyl-D-glucosamine dehydrogenase
VNRVAEALNAERKAVNGSRILLLGLAYKSNVDDLRESPTFKLFDLLKARGATIAYYDPHIPVIGPTREHAEWTGMKSVEWKREVISGFDAVVIATAHDAVSYKQLVDWAPCIVDTRNSLTGAVAKPGQVWKA